MSETRSVTDERERYSLFRLCECPRCDGSGKNPYVTGREPLRHVSAFGPAPKCPECRGEGRVRQEVAIAGTPEAVGVALVTLAREGEWEACQFGLLDREGEKGKRWLVLPWPETARTASAAGKLLRSRRQ